ncbi:MAG: hypothetical protein QOH88_3116 [Verrucomicrobiota bacterium]
MQREIEYFNQHWAEGPEWYRSHFDYSKLMVGEKTAELLHRLVTHERIQRTVPDGKLIIFLRNPVERAFSQWKMATRPRWGEERTFRAIIEEESGLIANQAYRDAFYECANGNAECWREGYLQKGLYAEQIEHLLKFFPRERIHIAITERVRRNMALEYSKVWRFLGLEPLPASLEERFVSANTVQMEPVIREHLNALYEPHNRRLFELLGAPISEWNEWSPASAYAL